MNATPRLTFKVWQAGKGTIFPAAILVCRLLLLETVWNLEKKKAFGLIILLICPRVASPGL